MQLVGSSDMIRSIHPHDFTGHDMRALVMALHDITVQPLTSQTIQGVTGHALCGQEVNGINAYS